MYLTCTLRDLQKGASAMQKVLALVPTHGVHIFHYVLLTASTHEQTLTLACANPECILLYRLPAQVSQPGRVLVPKHMVEWIKSEDDPGIKHIVIAQRIGDKQRVSFEGYYTTTKGKEEGLVQFCTHYTLSSVEQYPTLPDLSTIRRLPRLLLSSSSFTTIAGEVLPFASKAPKAYQQREMTCDLHFMVAEGEQHYQQALLLLQATDHTRVAQGIIPLARRTPIEEWDIVVDSLVLKRVREVLPKEGHLCLQYDHEGKRLALSTPDGTITTIVHAHHEEKYPTRTFQQIFSSSSSSHTTPQQERTIIQVSVKPLIKALERIKKGGEKGEEYLVIETLSVDHIQLAPSSINNNKKRGAGTREQEIHPQVLPAVVRGPLTIRSFSVTLLLELLKKLPVGTALLEFCDVALTKKLYNGEEQEVVQQILRLSSLMPSPVQYALACTQQQKEEEEAAEEEMSDDEKKKSADLSHRSAPLPLPK